ncbi:MAG: PBSX family phage terminase large subunit [Clostridia bacterium]|nr:PBSX family phage terminase large subunit [Clostridia bacterium]
MMPTEFSPKQMKLMTWWCRGSKYSSYDAVICDGAVRSGKTLCMGISFVLWSFYRFSGGSFALCGKTIRSLRRNVITPVTGILKNMGFVCNEKLSQNLIEISFAGKTNSFYLFGGKDEASAALIQGMTLCGVLFDEVALMPKSFVEQAVARCSVEGSRFWFNCNPEYPQHWFRVEWILGRKSKNAYYLRFTMDDNPSLSEKMKQRYRSLYSGVFFERFVLGKWVSASGCVYPFMNDDMFVEVPQGNFEKYVVSCDYGTVNPASFGLWGFLENVWFRIDEYYYDSRKEGFQRTDEEHYEALCRLAGDKKIEKVIIDPSAASFIQTVRRHGRFAVVPAENKVIDGIRKVSTVLKNGSVKICVNCKDSMREFNLYRWNSAGADAPVKENDHAMDDIRYFVSTVVFRPQNSFAAFAARRF